MTQTANDAQILSDILLQSGPGTKPSLMVFDIDSTIFDVSNRTTEIIRDFSKSLWNRLLSGPLCKQLASYEASPKDWGYIEFFRRHRIELSNRQAEKIHKYWHQRFFSNDYLGYDTPYPGALKYIHQWLAANNHVIYLTGRHADRMHRGTVEVFNKFDLPINENSAILKLKNEKSVPDEDFKLQYLLNLDTQDYEKVWFVENEPINLNIVERHAPHIGLIFFDSVHSGRAEITSKALRLSSYPLDNSNIAR